jgi:hypothetical protein
MPFCIFSAAGEAMTGSGVVWWRGDCAWVSEGPEVARAEVALARNVTNIVKAWQRPPSTTSN